MCARIAAFVPPWSLAEPRGFAEDAPSCAVARPEMGYARPMIEHAHAEMIRTGLVTPVAIGGADERAFLDCDLASMAENRLGDLTDPRGIDQAKRADWQARATSEAVYPLGARGEYETCYWLLEEGERVGTVAIATSTSGSPVARLSSLYVFPTHRRRGVGRRALDRVTRALAHHALGLCLETCWTWQRTVRFYQRAGLWVRMWKRDLTLASYLAARALRFELGPHEASMFASYGGAELLLARATRDGDALRLDFPVAAGADPRVERLAREAMSTFSLALAMEGFPLVRSPETFEQLCVSDAGPPEALAYKIQVWEAWDRHHGWIVDTPRIPGLEYPTWEELEARWAKANAEFEAKMKRGEPF